jgi:ATP-dependent RNA helicase RhlE
VAQKPQTDQLQAGVDVLIATPGRLLDLINQKYIDLNSIKCFVLDEADRMLDMGFGQDVKKVIKLLPQKRQTLLFSATMPSEIEKLANALLTDPVKISVTPVSSTVDTIEQSVYFVDKKDKRALLVNILKDNSIESALVFSRTKHGADRIAKTLVTAGIKAQAIHGDKSQGARQYALNSFKDKKIRVLVATDIAARGIDIDKLSHVFNFDLPDSPETYVHRIGRTGRAGLDGVSISFCDEDEKKYLKGIEKLIAKKIPVVENHKFSLKDSTPANTKGTEKRTHHNGVQRNKTSQNRQNKPSLNKTPNTKSPQKNSGTRNGFSRNDSESQNNAPQEKSIVQNKKPYNKISHNKKFPPRRGNS